NSIVTVVTPEEIERYLCATHAAQSMDAMRDDIPRWIRHLEELGVANVPLALGSASARHVDRMALQVSKDNPEAALRAHDIRDTMPELRRYKGRQGLAHFEKCPST